MEAGDKIYIVGERRSLETFYKMLEPGENRRIRTLKEFMESDYPDTRNALSCLAVRVTGREPYAGLPIRSSRISDRMHCMILGIQKKGMTITMPDANLRIQEGDILWVIGSNNNVGRLAALSIAAED